MSALYILNKEFASRMYKNYYNLKKERENKSKMDRRLEQALCKRGPSNEQQRQGSVSVLSCDTMIYNKKDIFGLHPCSWQRAPTALGISWSERRTRASFAMLMKWLWESLQIIQGWELMAWGTTHMVREPDPSGEGRGAGHWVQSVTNG